MTTTPKVSFQVMSGEAAKQPENILKLFEQIKGRKATDEEIAELMALQGGNEPEEGG